MPSPKRVDVADYFVQLSDAARLHMERLRELSLGAAPGLTETLHWNNPVYLLPYDRELPEDLCVTLIKARLEEYAATGSAWGGR